MSNESAAEMQINRVERIQRFRINLSDALINLSDSVEIGNTACRMVCEFLGASRATYALAYPDEQRLEVQDGWLNGAPGKGGTYSYRDLGLGLLERLSAGETVVVNDTSTHPLTRDKYATFQQLEHYSFIAVSFVKRKNLLGIVSVNGVGPREWVAEEAELLQDVARRLWDAIERSRSEAELRRVTLQYRALAETAASVVLSASPKGRITKISFVRNIEDHPERASSSTKILEVIHPFDRGHTLLEWKRSVAKKEAMHARFRMRTENGQFRWHSARAVPLEDLRGSVLEWVGAFVDIHEQFVQERTLRLLDNFSSKIRDITSPEEVVTIGQTLLGELLEASRVAYNECSEGSERWFGVSNYTNGCQDLEGEYPVTGPSSDIVNVLRNGKTLVVDELETGELGQDSLKKLRSAEIEAMICAPFIKDGKMIAMMAVHQKVRRTWTSDEVELVRLFCERCCSETQRTRAQQDLERSERELRTLNLELDKRVQERTCELTVANEEMELFTYSLAHDLRAPLRAIVSTSKILLAECPVIQPTERKMLERQAFNANRLGRLIDAILNLSRINRQPVSTVAFDFTALVNDVLNDVQTGACEIRVAPNLKSVGDPLLIRIVLQNLLENACKFSPSGGVVEVGERAVDGRQSYFVSDQGIGFEQKYCDKLFEPFQRLVGDSEFPGTGIGLANVKRIIRRHGGRVWVESELGAGSTFYFTLSR